MIGNVKNNSAKVSLENQEIINKFITKYNIEHKEINITENLEKV